jgi:DnaJ family protein C protein 17
LEILTDPSAKVAYDNLLKAKKLAEERNRELDSKRRKLKDDLEARERQADQRKADDTQAQRNMLAEIERLRKEGSKLLEQEQAYMREQMKGSTNLDEEEDADSGPQETPKIKLRWSAKKTDTYSAYDEEDLRALFSRYGTIANVLVSSKKKGSAIIEFEQGTPMLILAENERGTDSNPLTVTWLSGKPSSYQQAEKRPAPPSATSASAAPEQTPQTNIGFGFGASSDSSANVGFGFSSANMSGDAKDFESLVLMKMRQAEERKRLIEQMQKEDEEEEARNNGK